jgi:hypothetical protein
MPVGSHNQEVDPFVFDHPGNDSVGLTRNDVGFDGMSAGLKNGTCILKPF